MKVRFVIGRPTPSGKLLWLVDEHGCPLNTEPCAIVNDTWHPDFVAWLLAQEPDYPVVPLLWHPMLGETGGSGTGRPLATDEFAAAGLEPVQAQEGTPPHGRQPGRVE